MLKFILFMCLIATALFAVAYALPADIVDDEELAVAESANPQFGYGGYGGYGRGGGFGRGYGGYGGGGRVYYRRGGGGGYGGYGWGK